MKRLLVREIEHCFQCDHFHKDKERDYTTSGHSCALSEDRRIEFLSEYSIPHWCKLEKVIKNG